MLLHDLTEFITIFLMKQYDEAVHNEFSAGWDYYPGTCVFNPWVRIKDILIILKLLNCFEGYQ